MSDWCETLSGIHARLWQCLTMLNGPDRFVTLATHGRDNWPEARTIVLRDADAAAGTLETHTDRNSAKINSLRENPRATVLVWHPADQLQIRLRVEVFIQTGASVGDHWARVPAASRLGYGKAPPSGSPINAALDYERPGKRDAFAVLHCRVMQIDALHLGVDHRRATYSRHDDWAGQWLVP